MTPVMVSARIAVHIGYHKTATTWLQREIFPRHPRLRPLVTGSPHGNPFLAEIIGRADRDFDADRAREILVEQCAALAPSPEDVVVISAERLSGHAATGGYDAVRIADRLHAVVPDAKVFFAVREQVEMIESEYRQLVLEGSPAKLSVLLHRTPTWFDVGFDLGHYEYDRLADAYAVRFGSTQVQVFAFELISRDQAGFLGQLARFLEVADWPALPADVLTGRVNRGISPRLLGLRRAMNHFERSPLNPAPWFTLPPFWRTPLAALAARLPNRRSSLIDHETQEWIVARFRASNERLANRYRVELGDPSGRSR